MSNPIDFLDGEVTDAARRLLGCVLVREIDGKRLVGRIVETEAYHQTDAASHSYRGRTTRTDVMFGPAGHLYVYFTYGMHYCMNIVTGVEGEGSAVLIRAVEPLKGIGIMEHNRGGRPLKELTNGPAKVCQAFDIKMAMNGHDLSESPLILEVKPALLKDKIIATTRIGITKDTHRRWRFYEATNTFVSKPARV
jgi:DNA-3-methyladenine glycosylase